MKAVLREQGFDARVETIGQEFSIAAYIIHLMLLIGMFLSPPLALHYFQRCKL